MNYKISEYEEDLRKRLRSYIVKNPMPITKLAMDIGISYGALAGFMKGVRAIHMETACIIDRYLSEKEKMTQ